MFLNYYYVLHWYIMKYKNKYTSFNFNRGVISSYGRTKYTIFSLFSLICLTTSSYKVGPFNISFI